MIINKYLNNYLNTDHILLILFIILPVSLLTGSAIININIFLIDLIFLKILFSSKNFKEIFNDIFFYLLLLFFLSLIINIFFNNGEYFTYKSQIGILRFIIFIYAFKYILNLQKYKNLHQIMKVWSIIFIVVSIDLVFEFIFGYNLIGNTSYIPGRLSGFLGDELKIGNWYAGLVFLVSTFILLKMKNNKLSMILLTLFLIISFLIGERSNLIKIATGYILLLIFTDKLNLKLKASILIIFIFFTSLLVTNNSVIKTRFSSQVLSQLKADGLINKVMASHYGVHYYTAYKIFEKNPIFGIGVKQFRYESTKDIYEENKYNIHELEKWATHPHQIHFEFLSETGLFGYLIFLIFIITSIIISLKKYFKTKNNYLLASTIFIIISSMPIIPSGSFFTTYSATIFWLNYALMVALYDKISND